MKGDFTRNTFVREKHYSSVRWQQGRVGPLDAEWNEQLDIDAHHSRTTYRDVIGLCGAPQGQDADGNDLAGFFLTAAGANLMISRGRFYGHGILCENEADVLLTEQAELPDYGPLSDIAAGEGIYLAYLDIWERHITALDDDNIREVALGGPDTTTRTKVVWQVKLEGVAELGQDINCDAFGPHWRPSGTTGAGELAARAEPSEDDQGPCVIPPQAGYRRLENQLYRVEIHMGGAVDTATFKWSRENGSIVTRWEAQDGNNLTVSSAGRDRLLGFNVGDWVELIDDTRELRGRPGVLVRLNKVEGTVLTIDPATIQDPDNPGATSVDRANFPGNPKLRRWESEGAEIVAIPADNDGWLELEEGVQIKFGAGGVFQSGDYWLIPARTAKGDILWPREPATGEALFQHRDGVTHYYCPLALVTLRFGEGEELTVDQVEDCRPLFPPLTHICAEDVCFDNTQCALPGVETVQDALDRLCERNDLPHHNKHLHGWGIVCGLQVVCGPNEGEETRRRITVGDGYALDCQGNDIILNTDQSLDLLEMIERHRETTDENLLDDNGNGDICLILNSDPQRPFSLERHQPNQDKNPWQALLAGTLLMDFYENCLRRIVDFIREEFTPPREGERRPAGPTEERIAAFTNLMAQPVNPTTGQHIFISLREHKIMLDFYTRLRALLQSETYCAMFDNARPFPDYPEEFLAAGMDTAFGKSFHTRLRLRPRTAEGYTVGAGLNPLKPSTTINRYQLAGEDKRMIAQIDPVAGAEIDQLKNDSGAGAVQDVAFSPDGRQIYVIISSRDDEDTFFRVGRFRGDTIDWQPMAIICGVKLVTLATTQADPTNVYAVGMKKVIVREGGRDRVEFRGMGLYRITPDNVNPTLEPLVSFNARGHLRITPDGRAFATAAAEDVSSLTYDRIVAIRLPQGELLLQEPILLGAQGSDDIAIVSGRGVEVETIYSVVGPVQGVKEIRAHRMQDGQPLRVNIPVANTAIRLEPFMRTRVLLITSADGYNVQMVNLATNEFVADYLLPMQVDPMAIAASEERRSVFVLNSSSNTITTIENASTLQPDFRFNLQLLAEYRAAVLNAFTDLLAGFLQYLKDCLCQHFLVNCPECTGEEKLYLACVSVRGGQVERVCNFSKRQYVKSFPTVGYWLSIIPIMPMIDYFIEQFCCMVLPNRFSRIVAKPSDERYTAEYKPRVSTGAVFQGVGTLQGLDLLGQFNRFLDRGRQAQTVAVDRLQAAPRTAVVQPAQPSRPIVNRPIDAVAADLTERGVTVRRAPYDPGKVTRLTNIFRTPAPGSEVTLYEENGLVRYFDIAAPSVRTSEALAAQVQELSEALQTRDSEVQALRTQVEALTQKQSDVEPKALAAEVTALRAELEELRGLREEMTELMRKLRK